MLQAALKFAKPAVGLLKTQTPRIASAAQWLQNPLNRAAVGGGLGFLSNNEGTLSGRIRGGLTGAAFEYPNAWSRSCYAGISKGRFTISYRRSYS